MSSSSLSRKLYRLLLRSSKSIRDKRNRELLISTVDHCQDHLSRLTFNDTSITSTTTPFCFKNDTKEALKYCFKKGSTDNTDIIVSLLPRLNRYFKAANVIIRYIDNTSTSNTYNNSMLNGAILVSQLYHNSKVNEDDMIKAIDDGIETIVYKTIEELEMTKLSQNLLEVVIDDIHNNHIVLDDEKYEVNGHMYRMVDILKAFNKVLEERESNRIKGNSNRIVHLIDQIFQKDVKYKDAMPLVHSVIASEALSRLGVDLRGAYIQSIFLTKICEDGDVGDTNRSISVADNKFDAKEVVGTWVALYPSGMQEVSVDIQNNSLVATKVDGDVYVPANAITWRINAIGTTIESNVDYPAELQVAKESFSKPKMKRCKIRFVKVESSKSSYHYEIIMNPLFDAGAEEVTGIEEEGAQKLTPVRNDQQWDPTVNFMYFFKTTDLTKVFIDMSERGVIPMSNFVLEGMIKRYSLSRQNLTLIPKISTSHHIASRMIADIYRNTVRRNINTDNINYWSSITRQIESLLSKND